MAAGIAPESKEVLDMRLQLLVAPVIDRSDAPAWEDAGAARADVLRVRDGAVYTANG